MIEQADLFRVIPVGRRPGETIQEAFEAFHDANPSVYTNLVALAKRAKDAGRKSIGIGMLFEVLRWNYSIRTQGEDFKLNNNFRSRYARMIERNNADLIGFFEKRELKAQ
jgi:hypothetical protein